MSDFQEGSKLHLECAINALGYSSFLKGIPMSEENMDIAKTIGQEIYETSRKNIRIKFRGPRLSSSYHTLKKDAVSFDVYFWER